MFRHLTRNEVKQTLEPRTGICTKTRPVPAYHKLPVANFSTNRPRDTSTNNRENKTVLLSGQIQKPRIPPRYCDYSKATPERRKCRKEVYSKPPSCTTCRLNLSEQNRIPPRYTETGRDTTEPARGNKAFYKALARYLQHTKRIVCREKPEQKVVTKNSKVPSISARNSNIYRVYSKVSFSDELKYYSRANSSELSLKRYLEFRRRKSRYRDLNEYRKSHDHSLSRLSDEAKKLREKVPHFSMKIASKSSRSNIKMSRSAKENKIRFERQLHSYPPAEMPGSLKYGPATIDEWKSRVRNKKTLMKSIPNRLKMETKPLDSTNKSSQQSDTGRTKDVSIPRVHKKENKSESHWPTIEQKPSCRVKSTSQQSESKQFVNKVESYACEVDIPRNEIKPCEHLQKSSNQLHSNTSRGDSGPHVKNKTTHPCATGLSKDESKMWEKETKKYEKTIIRQTVQGSRFKSVAKETQNDPCGPETLGHASVTGQSFFTKESSSQCRETVKRATSPINVKIKSIGVDGFPTLDPSSLGM